MKGLQMKTITVNESDLPLQVTYATKTGRAFEYTLKPAGRKTGLLLNKPDDLCGGKKSPPKKR